MGRAAAFTAHSKGANNAAIRDFMQSSAHAGGSGGSVSQSNSGAYDLYIGGVAVTINGVTVSMR